MHIIILFILMVYNALLTSFWQMGEELTKHYDFWHSAIYPNELRCLRSPGADCYKH